MDAEVTYSREHEILLCETAYYTRRYRVFQVYGQKYVQPIDDDAEPEAANEVYCCNIPRNIDIEDLFKFFLQCGPIFKIRLLMDFSGCNRGKCFVLYTTFQASREAICCLDDEDIGSGHRVGVRPSLNNNQLILRAIPAWIPVQFITDSVERTFGEGLVRVDVKKSTLPYKNNCFCIFRDHRSAVMAHKKCWPYISIGGMPIEVNWTIPKLLKFSSNLYFTNFAVEMTKREFFEELLRRVGVGSLVKFRKANYSGYITFCDDRAMKTALLHLRNIIIRGHQLQFSEIPFGGASSGPWYSGEKDTSSPNNSTSHQTPSRDGLSDMQDRFLQELLNTPPTAPQYAAQQYAPTNRPYYMYPRQYVPAYTLYNNMGPSVMNQQQY